MKNILFTILTLAPCLTFGTNQIKEKIIYNGVTNTLFTFPLSDDLRVKARYEVDPVTGNLSTRSRMSTACWRGYVGTWEFTTNTLYLVRLQDGVEHKDIPASQLIKDEKYPIKASWFTGDLRIGTGNSHMRFSSTEVFLPMTNGVLSAEPEHIDRLQEQEAFKEELVSCKDSSNQLDRDLYEYVFHYNSYDFLDKKIDAFFEISTRDLSEVRYPNCSVFNRAEEPVNYIRTFVRFRPTPEPRVYQAESIHRKLHNPDSIHFVAFLDGRVLSISGTPNENKNHTWEPAEDGQSRKLRVIKSRNPEQAKQECFDSIVNFRDMLGGDTIIPEENTLNVSIMLSTHVLSLNDPLTVSVTASNQGNKTVSICVDDLEIDFLIENSNGDIISGLGKKDWQAWGVVTPAIFEAGESKSFGYFQSSIRNRTWSDYSEGHPFPKYKGVGLDVNEAILETGYPLKTIPGDYFISVRIRVRRDKNFELKFVSDKQKIHINK